MPAFFFALFPEKVAIFESSTLLKVAIFELAILLKVAIFLFIWNNSFRGIKMLKRKIYDYLIEWKKTKKYECLLVNGARQVGKTFIIEYFGKNEYEKYFYLNFIKNPEYKQIFEGSLEPVQIYKKMSLFLPDFSPVDKNTLIFLDEIQRCPKARTALKFLAMDQRYDFIASGSLLGIHYKDEEKEQEEISIPVGYEHEIEMTSLDFEEYLWAIGATEEAVQTLKEYLKSESKIDNSVLERYSNLITEYMVVGGMPEVVTTMVNTSNYQEVYETQQKILKAYKDDIKLYAKNTEIPKITACYDSIPRQLSNEYTKFKYKTVEKGGSARKYENALDWLIGAGLIKQVLNVSLPVLPLKAYEIPDEFKIYATDTGLATSMFGYETQAALLKNTLTGPAKGGIYENLVFDILNKKQIHLNYFRRDEGKQEIEFLFEKDGNVIPVEVKAGRGKTVSLNSFIEEYKPSVAYKLISGNTGREGCKTTLPHFLLPFI